MDYLAGIVAILFLVLAQANIENRRLLLRVRAAERERDEQKGKLKAAETSERHERIVNGILSAKVLNMETNALLMDGYWRLLVADRESRLVQAKVEFPDSEPEPVESDWLVAKPPRKSDA